MARENKGRGFVNPRVTARLENTAKRAARLEADCGPDRDSRESVAAYQAQRAAEAEAAEGGRKSRRSAE